MPAAVSIAVPTPTVATTWRPRTPVDIAATLRPLRRGSTDPAFQLDADGALWLTGRTPAGPATLRLVTHPAGEVRARAWGPGAEWMLAGVPDLLGAADDPAGFRPRHPLLRDAHRRYPGLRVPRCRRVLDVLAPAVLEQKVTGAEARRSWRELLRRFGEPAPGPTPAGMRVPPAAATWRRVPSWEWHRAGVDSHRSGAICAAAAVAGRLEESVAMLPTEAERRLRSVPGVGVWTAAEVAQRALGDADAVSVGDFHLAPFVGWALAGRAVDDDGMLELLAPYRGHRYRAIRLLELSGFRMPRFGPRYAPRDLRAC
ncbi:MAG: DNA-3-methyladenine glycosylase family protein [Mycobacteriales bacterium]